MNLVDFENKREILKDAFRNADEGLYSLRDKPLSEIVLRLPPLMLRRAELRDVIVQRRMEFDLAEIEERDATLLVDVCIKLTESAADREGRERGLK